MNDVLNIVCLLKITEDTEDIPLRDYEAVKDNIIDTSYVRRIINCFDEAALENALRVKEQRSEKGLETVITVLTLDPGYCGSLMDSFYAIGADRVVILENGSDLRFCPETTAEILSDAARRLTDDPSPLIFAGTQAPPGNSGLVPVYTAQRLGLLLIDGVSDVDATDTGIRIKRICGDHEDMLEAGPGAVVVFENTVHSYLRAATLRQKLKFKGMKPETVQDMRKPPENRLNLLYADRSTDCRFLEGGPAEMAAEILELMDIKAGS